MEQVLASLDKVDASEGGGRRCISASKFQDVLDSHGLHLGNPQADQVVLMCKVTPEGKIDYNRFANEILQSQSNGVGSSQEGEVVDSPTKWARPTIKPPVPSSSKPPSLEGLHQRDKVFKLCTQIRSIFNSYDTGHFGPSTLAKKIRALGLKETSAFQALLRHAAFDMTYHQLMRALSSEDEIEDFHFQTGTLPSHEFNTTRNIHQGNDVVTWRDIKPEDHPSAGIATSKNALELRSGLGVQNAIQTSDYDSSDAFVTTTQKQQQNSLEQPHHGHRTPDIDVLRQQVYSTIRQLDSGRIDVPTFERQLGYLDIEIPPDVRRLLNKTVRDGSANFKQFVRAFDSFFNDKQRELERAHLRDKVGKASQASFQPSEQQRMKEDQQIRLQSNEQRKAGTRHIAQMSHGDLITWRNEPTSLEKFEVEAKHNGRRHHVASFNKASDLQRSSASELLAWDTERSQPNVPEQPIRRLRGAGPLMTKSDSNIIAWPNTPPPPPPQANLRARQTENTVSCPYGTETNYL